MNLSEPIISQALAMGAQQAQTADIVAIEERDLLTPAAVLVPLVERQFGDRFGYHVLLTRRAQHLKHHAGQISFPGGRQESHDLTLVDTALRETHEEIGLTPNRVKIIGELPQHETITRYLMTPYVGIIKERYQLALDPNEVDEAFEVPLSFVCDPDNHKLQSAYFQGKKRYYYTIQYEQYNIWGATARVLVEFSKMIHRLL